MDRVSKIVELARLTTVSERYVKRRVKDRTSILTMEQFEILDYISRGVQPPTMASELGITHQGVMSRVNTLISSGYVTKEPDGREVILKLTDRGMRAFQYYGEILVQETATVMSLVSDKEIDCWIKILERMNHGIDVSLPYPD